MNNLQVLSRILILATPFLLPWWLVLIIALASLFLFENYWEIVLLAFMCDVLYASSHSFFGLYGLTLVFGLIFILVRQFKKRLIMY